MKLKRTYLLILFCSLFYLVSCERANDSQPIDIDGKYVNEQILLRPSNVGNTFKTQDTILLELKYNTNFEITFPCDYNVQIFEKTKDGWSEIFEIPTTIIPPDDIVFSPDKYMPFVHAIYVAPDLSDKNRKYSLRIFVSGNMDVNGEIIKVAAYSDVTLRP